MKSYVLRVIEWLEDNANKGKDSRLTPRSALDVAKGLRDEMPKPPARTTCAKPKTHAPGCDCAGLGLYPIQEDEV